MARAAGTNESEVVIQKFLGRNEMRAKLLEEREEARQRIATLEADMRHWHAKMMEIQCATVMKINTLSM